MSQGCSLNANEMDPSLTSSQTLSDDLEEVLLLLPHLNRKSKLVQRTLAELEEDIDIILSLQPGGDDSILCGEDEVVHQKEKNEKMLKVDL